jgi:Arc/MetJ-type ribon-helix-helix transcriptional regulator
LRHRLASGYLEDMSVDLKPETEQLVREEIEKGHFHSVDELITESVCAWHAQHGPSAVIERKSLFDLLTQPPFAGSDLDLERQRDYPRPIDL